VVFFIFYGSKYLEGAGDGCIMKDPNGKKTLIACILEFQCTNTISEYEALLQGLRKEIDLKVTNIKVFGDSKIVIRQVRNTIHCRSSHLKTIHYKVTDLTVEVMLGFFSLEGNPLL
jgi:ribonuclease HI